MTCTNLTIKHVARLINVSPDVVRTLIRTGALPASDVATSPGKRRWRVSTQDLENFLNSRRNIPPPKPVRPKRSTGDDRKYY